MIVVVVALLACQDAPPVAEVPKPEPQGLVPIAPEDFSSFLHRSGDRVRVVNLWATWCQPCVREMPAMAKWAEQHPEVRLEFVNLEPPKQRSRIEAGLKRHGLFEQHHYQIDTSDPSPILTETIADWTELLPMTLIIDQQGATTASIIGETRGERLDGAIRTAIR